MDDLLEDLPQPSGAEGALGSLRRTVDTAISGGLCIQFVYTKESGEISTRVVRPREYSHWGNAVRGFCFLTSAERVFTLSRMSNPLIADEPRFAAACVQLFQHQEEILRVLAENDRYLLLAEMGTGKTLPMLIHLSNLLLARTIENAMVVAPLSALDAWQRDIEKLTTERRRVVRRCVSFVNYDKLSRANSAFQKEYWRSWGCIVLDEGHAIANPLSNRTQYFVGRGARLGLLSKCRYFYLMTGTLVTNGRLEDLWSPLRGTLGEEWMSYRDFCRRFLVVGERSSTSDQSDEATRELLSLVGRHSYRVLKADCLDLPEMMPDTVVTVPFADGTNGAPFGKTTRELYEEAARHYLQPLDMKLDSPLARLMKMRQIAAGFIKESDTQAEGGAVVKGAVHPLNNDKIKYALELVESNLPHKTVVFHTFVASGLAMEHGLSKAGIPYLALNGAQKDKSIWRRFQSNPAVKVIVVQYASGATGIDLFAASTTVFLEPTDSTTVLSQSRSRTHRSGQVAACNYYFLLTQGSVEADIYDRVASGEDFTEQAYREMVQSTIGGEQGESLRSWRRTETSSARPRARLKGWDRN